MIDKLIEQAKNGKIHFPFAGIEKTPGSHDSFDPNKNKRPEFGGTGQKIGQFEGGSTQYMPESPDLIRATRATMRSRFRCPR